MKPTMKGDAIPNEPGEEFLVVTCKSEPCSRPIAIFRTWATQMDERGQISFQPVAQPMICPYCETQSVFLPADIWRLRVTATREEGRD
jgi:hypothetical protein